MKKNLWKQMRMFALAGIMSLALLGCGGSDDPKDETPVQEEGQPDALEPEEKESPETSQSPTENAPNQGEDADKKAENANAQKNEGPIGEITTLGDGQFTIKEFYQETGEDGSEILASPAEGVEDEAGTELDTLTVLCDENTRIYKRTIRNGGASYEDSESSFEKLEKGMQVNLKGSYEGDAYRASEVQIVDVIL